MKHKKLSTLVLALRHSYYVALIKSFPTRVKTYRAQQTTSSNEKWYETSGTIMKNMLKNFSKGLKFSCASTKNIVHWATLE
jgi:hypothetical protein